MEHIRTASSQQLYSNILLPSAMILIWFFFNVTTVVLNKYLYVFYEFNFPFSLTAVHMFVCFLGSLTVLRLFPNDRFKYQPISFEVWKKAVLVLA